MAKLLVQTEEEYREQLELGKRMEDEARRIAAALEAQGAGDTIIRLRTRAAWQASREANENAIIWEWGTLQPGVSYAPEQPEEPRPQVDLLAAARAAKWRRQPSAA